MALSREERRKRAAATSAKNLAATLAKKKTDPNFKTFEQKFKEDTTRRNREARERTSVPPPTQKLTGDALINSQIAEAEAAGNLEDVATLRALLGGGSQAPTTGTNLKSDLLKLEEQQKLADVARSADIATKAVEERDRGIEPRIKGLKSEASVATQVGQKRLKDLFAATGAAAGTGAARQIAGEQALQGQLGALDVQKEQEQAQVARDLSDIISEKAFLERQIRTGTATRETEFQIKELEAAQAQAAKEAEINSEREFELYKDNIDRLNNLEVIKLKDDLEKENTLLDAEIQLARDNNDFEQAKVLEGVKQANRIKLEAINSSNTIKEIEARGGQDRLTSEFRDTLKDEEEVEEPLFSDSDINFSVNRAIQGATSTLEDFEVTPEIEKQAVKEWIISNVDSITAEQGDNLVIRYSLNDSDLAEIQNRLNLQGSQPISPGGQ